MELLSPISEVKGVGEKTTKLFNNLGVYTIKDILLFFPRTYLTYPEPCDLNADCNNKVISILGRLKNSPKVFKSRRGINVSSFIYVNDVIVEAVWFNAAYIKNELIPGKQFVFYGKLSVENGRYKMVQPKIYSVDEYRKLLDSVWPIYPLTKGLTNNVVIKVVKQAFDSVSIDEDRLPNDIVEKYDLIPYSRALFSYHFPENYDELLVARRRLAFEELFFFVLNSKLQEQNTISYPNEFCLSRQSKVDEIISGLPYSLTKAQLSTLNDIRTDLSGTYISQRLIQGDVGSGKTIVAFLAMVETGLCGYQSAIMAPTEVLARQHYDNFISLCERFNLNIPVAIFLGSQKASERKINQQIVDENNNCIIVGTHALISEKREFNNLALVITDEQHRFGVRQRENFSLKGNNPHMVVMSATPIPRTLAMILYGNMHVSVINELPSNRLPIKTCVIKEHSRTTAYKFIVDEIEKGHQAYIICPLVEASETTEAQNVIDYSEKLNEFFCGKYSIGLLHGRMKAAEKNEVMERFSQNEVQILVSTTVVEVGVNVPNATVIMIENANRFGLAALHQLRGRVGRGDAQSYCILMNSENGNKSERLDVMLKSNDGFFIAREDLKLRGPGDLFGVRQSGEFSFKVADIYNDAKDMENASKEAEIIIKKDPNLSNNEKLRSTLSSFLSDQLYVL